jgi:hypothetical protein
MEKLSKSPKLFAALSNPESNKIFQEMGKNPGEAMKKYGGNPQFREMMQEYA